MKTSTKGKWWLVLLTLLIIAPGTYASKTRNSRGCDGRITSTTKCQQAPEGGSAAVYALGMAITCLSAMFIRSRVSQPKRVIL